ncbi:uncharacterized protein LOC110036912 isoform X2 [Phalaenopsis equestris]|uniref:uncharacterized protein LOC110036912 isoform X2 n=1 Tax=Phalaenopsis equestris TaxID=78828 RepID=UPI0009E64AC7|nr:uncharacterized protein LOC110036912 isoform X2 [Phalaenopsis equestris]
MRETNGLCLEDYARFFNKEEELQLTRPSLCKVQNIKKSSLLDVLRTVDLTPPGRSTIEECPLRSSTDAELSLDEVMKDIASLGWHECPIVSILTIYNNSAKEAAKENAPISSSCTSDRAKMISNKGEASKRSGTKRKGKKSVEELVYGLAAIDRACEEASSCPSDEGM